MLEDVVNGVQLVTCSNASCGFVDFYGSESALEQLLGPLGLYLVARKRPEDIQVLRWFVQLRQMPKHFTSFWEVFSDEQICELLGEALKREAPILHQIAAKLMETVWSEIGRADVTVKEHCIDVVANSLALSLADAYMCRVERNESDTGALVRRWISHGPNALTEDELATLRKRGQWRRRDPDGWKEHHAKYWTALTERIDEAAAEVFRVPITDRFNIVLNGAFNKVASQADNTVREQVRQREAEVEQTETVGPKIELVRADPPGAEAEVLLAEFRNLRTLTPRERQVLGLRLEGRTQLEIAKSLKISQPRANQLLGAVGKKVRKALAPLVQ
ncbi:MAG TPA: sigma factor-like helix-turn-helix DNA-binding protein [Vicinamibacterales bacterium]|nr:sigma factor-like helix-turn-helix DNA-binding protein [Vicinamibacterales bacterium]